MTTDGLRVYVVTMNTPTSNTTLFHNVHDALAVKLRGRIIAKGRPLVIDARCRDNELPPAPTVVLERGGSVALILESGRAARNGHVHAVYTMCGLVK